MINFLFKHRPFNWLFWVSAVYAVVGLANASIYRFTEIEYIQFAYLLILSLPLWIKPLAKFLNMKTLWEK
jgi:hypothetical protein